MEPSLTRGPSKRPPRLRMLLAGAATLLTALALAGCGAGTGAGTDQDATPNETSSGTTATEMRTIKVGTLPVASTAALHYAIDQGIFEKHGLSLELVPSQSGAALVPAVVSGNIDIGFSSPLSVVLAAHKGAGVSIVSGYSNSNPTGNDVNVVMVKADSGIKDYGDLPGHTVAVNAVNTQGDLMIRESARLQGGDPEAINFNEIGFSDMQAQLDAGNTEAVWVPDPFMSRMMDDPAYHSLGSPYQGPVPGQPTQMSFASTQFTKANPELIKDFQAAMKEAMQAADQNQDTVRTKVTEFIKIDPKEAQSLELGHFDGEVPVAALEKVASLMLEYHYVDSPIDIPSMVVQP